MTLDVAVVGSGSFAREHVAALARLPDVRLKYVVGSDPGRADAVAALAPGAAGTTDLDAVLADPGVVGVDVVNANPQHARVVIAAGGRGKHLHVEKPAALAVDDLDAMVDATRDTSLMVGQTVRFQPIIATTQQAIARGEIGRPRMLHVSWYTGHVWPGGWRGWQLDRTQSGGHPVHNGGHPIDLAVWLLGRTPVRVFARSFPSFAAGMPVHDSFHLTLRFDDGSLALLELSYALARRGDTLRRFVVVGEDGTLAHSTDDEPSLVTGARIPPPPSIEGALDAQLAHWAEVVRGDAEPLVGLRDVRASLLTSLAAQESLDTGRAVTIDTGRAEQR